VSAPRGRGSGARGLVRLGRMSARGYVTESEATDSSLSLALAPALTPEGLTASPSFFHGFATEPRAVAQGLVALADITATRYFQPVPTTMRDPVLTAHGDRLRAEVFSADNSVYARLDLLASGLDGGEISYGTTNVDIGTAMRRTLAAITRNDLLHLDVGADGLTAATPSTSAVERPVTMPDRWVRALGNAAEVHASLAARFTIAAAPARAFVASLPPSTGSGRDGWLTPTPTGIRVAPRGSADAVHVSGLHRLSGLKRLLTQLQSLTVYGPRDGSAGGAAVEVEIPGARLLIALTENATRGYSGEGALLASLAATDVLDNAAVLSALLSFDPRIDIDRLATDAALSTDETRESLAVLAASGRVGWDLRDEAYFHRELPDDPDRIDGDNPRLVRARRIVTAGGVRRTADTWTVDAVTSTHIVRATTTGHSCTCVWYARHGSGHGPCAHVLAVMIAEGTAS